MRLLATALLPSHRETMNSSSKQAHQQVTLSAMLLQRHTLRHHKQQDIDSMQSHIIQEGVYTWITGAAERDWQAQQ